MLEDRGLAVAGSVFVSAAFLYGFVHGLLLGRRSANVLGWASFVAACAVSLPMVLTTYGKALIIWFPLAIAFALVVTGGFRLGSRAKEASRAFHKS